MIRVGDYKIGEEERTAINEVLDSGRITEWQKVRDFEHEWAKYVDTKYAICVNSGTSALIAGLLALKYKHNLPNGTKVLTSPVTYIATINAIVLAGFEPVFVDIDSYTFTLNTEKVEQYVIDRNVKIVLPVHLMGYMNQMDELVRICSEHDVILFEDVAQAHGSIYNERKAGSFGLLSAFSFYVAHNIACGELGVVNTNDLEILKLIRKLKANGRMCVCNVCKRDEGKCPYKEKDFDPRFTHDLIGYNFKAMEFQAALGLVQLRKAKDIIKKRRENVKYLNEGLGKFKNVLQLPKYDSDVSYLAYPLVIKKPEVVSRGKIQRELEKKGVETRPLFGCVPFQPAYSYLRNRYEGKLPNAGRIGENGFYIPCHQYLTQADLDYIIHSFTEVFKK